MNRALATLLAWLFSASLVLAATLLPPGEQQFFDLSGRPLSGGSVGFYIPGTLTPKTVWSNSTQTSPLANPVPLSAGGFATIYGSGTYRMIVKDAAVPPNTIYDQLTADTSTAGGLSFGGTSTGTANAQLVAASSFTLTDGQVVNFRAGFTNTAALTINANSTGVLTVVKDTPSGPQPLTGGEVVGGNAVSLLYDAVLGQFHIVNELAQVFGTSTSIAAAPTTNIGSAPGNVATVTGSGQTITSFGSSGSLLSPIYMVTFSGANTIANSVSLVTPSAINITTAAGDFIIAQNRGSGAWTILQYVPATQVVSITALTSGSGNFNAALFKTLRVTLIGGGGGGGASATNGGAAGGASTFSTFTAGGGGGGLTGGATGGTGGAGGNGGSGSCTLRLNGAAGMGAATNFSGGGIGSPPNLGGNGGSSPFGGAGMGSTLNDHLIAVANSGSGGGGAALIGPGASGGGGGGAGEYVRDCIINVAAATYAWTVGAAGAGGAAGTTAGGAGGSGVILVEAYR